METPEGLHWVEPWGPVMPSEAGLLEDELRREVIPGHPLHGVPVRAFGRFDGRDDVAFALADGRFAVAHLTWIVKPEQSADWPLTEVYPDVAALQARLQEDHDTYT